MKMVQIKPVPQPESFTAVKFTQEDWKAANKLGTLTVPAVTAVEALKNSKGLYKIVDEAAATVQVEFQGLKDPEQMTSQELVAEMTSHGKPPRKRMERKTAVNYIKDLRAKAAEMIIDDD
jgi:hypothetical protein